MPRQYEAIRDYYVKKGLSLKKAKELGARTYNKLNPNNPLHGAELKKGGEGQHAKSGGKSAHSPDPKPAPAHEPDVFQDDTIGPQNKWFEYKFSKEEMQQIQEDYAEYRKKYDKAHPYTPNEGEWRYPLTKD